ncbi:peptidoglycan DD-metalloendopeptidase family protein [Patescibacteria group bacterium]|nr:peptidoglycan DD-metalloendopeptidase family protein [Patescibacteria group bacterium]
MVFKTSSFSPQNTGLSSTTLQENILASVSQRFSGSIGQESLFLGKIGLEEPEFPSLNIVQNNSLVGISPPITVSPKVLGSSGNFNEEPKEVSEYVVQFGDNLSLIAEKFNISLNTLLWANDLSSSSSINSGQKLIILPVSGILHHVKNGETLSGITKTYQGDIAEIVSFNELSGESIFIGDILIIPDGKMPSKPKYTSAPVSQIPLAGSYFIFPTQGKISQGLHWYNAVDIANDCGNPIYAAAGGKVLSTKYGYNLGAGNYIKILHPNGAVTFYGHLNSILIGSGQSVSQGQTIALTGGKPGTLGAGISTGCHLHFEVRGARNPFAG